MIREFYYFKVFPRLFHAAKVRPRPVTTITIVALLDVRPEVVLREFCRERALFVACEISGAITKIDSVDRQRMELKNVCSCTEIHERNNQ
jgi:hypothetical protein